MATTIFDKIRTNLAKYEIEMFGSSREHTLKNYRTTTHVYISISELYDKKKLSTEIEAPQTSEHNEPRLCKRNLYSTYYNLKKILLY